MSNPLSVCLWFEGGQAKEAAEYYCGIFKDSKIIQANEMVTTFKLNGNELMALNGNNQSQFNESVSLMVNCDTQEEIDHYWNSLSANGGSESVCGWLKDKYGVSWQIIPSIMGQLMADPEKMQRVIQKVMQMKKLIIAEMENA
jgi:predicted 3-demethylubiquinone-9 3-methyltransferase (glyoxalase superfamily)